MKIKAAFLLTFLLFFSFLTAGSVVLTEETRTNIVSAEYEISSDESSDDVEMYSVIMSVTHVSLPPILHITEATAISVFVFDLLEPPKLYSFIS